jgi:hypothetical protein
MKHSAEKDVEYLHSVSVWSRELRRRERVGLAVITDDLSCGSDTAYYHTAGRRTAVRREAATVVVQTSDCWRCATVDTILWSLWFMFTYWAEMSLS